MKAEAKSLRFFGEKGRLTVPFFQRRYVWTESNWKELLEMFDSPEQLPYLGSIILKEESAKESIIVDGQQRLTTITILAKAIYDCFSAKYKDPDSGVRFGIEHYLFYRVNSADSFKDSKVRIEHSKLDQEDYNRVIEANMLHDVPEIDLDTINENSGGILKCYKYFCNYLKDKGDEKLKEIFNIMFDDNNKVFVLIELSKGDIDEQTIFDTINRAGVRLSTADIIKNNLFKRMLEKCSDNTTVQDLYTQCWEKVFYSNQQDSEIWDKERIFGNVTHSNLEFLLYCVACIKWGEDRDMFAKLANVFDRETSEMSFNDIKLLVTEIQEYAILFKENILDLKELLDDEYSSVYFKYSEGVKRLLFILQKFGVQMFYPFVIKRIKEMNNGESSEEEVLDDFHVLESFIMRRKISPKGTHDYTSKCYCLIKDGIKSIIESDLANDDAGISETDVKRYLGSTKDEAAKMILFWTELYLRDKPGFDVDALEYKYTLEHIMPKKWKDNWSNVPIVQNGTVLSVDSEEGIDFRNYTIQSIGNKTLLTGSLNSTVKNSEFSKKINGTSETRPGYKSHTSLLLTKEIVDNAEIECVWDEKHILDREDRLFNYFVKLWPSYKEKLTEKEKEQDTINPNMFTPEQLDDPLKMLEAMDEVNEPEGMYSISDFVRRVNVQSETVKNYIYDGRITPDLVKSSSEHRKNYYFSEKSILKYANDFGWDIITDDNRKDIFIEYVSKMNMSYSYKPVLISALIQNSDDNGQSDVSTVIASFCKFYEDRRNKGLVVEQQDSILADINYKTKDVKDLVFRYPYNRLYEMGIVSLISDGEKFQIDRSIWDKLNQKEKNTIIEKCEIGIEQYFSKLENKDS